MHKLSMAWTLSLAICVTPRGAALALLPGGRGGMALEKTLQGFPPPGLF